MKFEELKNFGVTLNGVYKIKKGVVLGITYSEKKKRIAYVFKAGDYAGLEKYFFNVGLLELIPLGDVEYEFISDEELKKILKKTAENKIFEKYLKEFFMEIIALSKEGKKEILIYNLRKIMEFSTEFNGISKDMVIELEIKDEISELIREGIVFLSDEVYKVKK
jgi:hypothetical protein